ncbi:MAG: PEP-CTERM sorting domain-containing protein [Desulfobacteraceae bacterium]|nr:PEP-CTERM sorting domain-containing protein [Desulfobacteraceae bacterium]
MKKIAVVIFGALFLMATNVYASSVVGTWYIGAPGAPGAGGGGAIINFLSNGDYFMAEDGVTGGGGYSGMERGTYTWDPATGNVSIIDIFADTNGEWGFSHPYGPLSIKMAGDSLTVTDTGGSDSIDREPSLSTSVVGAWYIGAPGSGGGGAIINFLSNGDFFIAEDGETDSSGDDGMERGSYTWDAATGDVSITNIFADTNGQWGFSDPIGDLLINVNGDFLTVADDGGSDVFSRVGASSTVPVPGAIWLLGSGLLGLAGISRRKK